MPGATTGGVAGAVLTEIDQLQQGQGFGQGESGEIVSLVIDEGISR